MLMHIADVISFNYYESLLKSHTNTDWILRWCVPLAFPWTRLPSGTGTAQQVERAMQLLAVESLQSVDLS